MDRPLRGPALHEAVRNYIKEYILEHDLAAGDPLPPETQLARDLGVGRSSVREAIKALQSLGIVDVRHGDGLYVREYNFDSLLETLSYGLRFDHVRLAELFQVRVWLESAVIADAVEQITPEELAQLDTIMTEWEGRVQAGESFADLDEQFHCILYGTLNNQTLIKLFEVFWIAFNNFDLAEIHDVDPLVELEQHRAVLESLRARDASLARLRLIQSFSNFQRRIERVTETDRTPPQDG